MKADRKHKLCPFKKTVERETDSLTGKTIMRERFEPCVGKRCMAYVYTASCLHIGGSTAKNQDYWGCARLLSQGADDGV